MGPLIMHFARLQPAAPTHCVDRPAGDDRRQPRLNRPHRFIGVPHTVNGQERILEDVLNEVIRTAPLAR